MVRAERLALAFALATWGPGVASADPALVVTRSASAVDCPDAAQLAAEVARLNNTASGMRLHVAFGRDDSGYRAVVVAFGGGERRLSDAGPSCENLAEAVALALALILDARETTPERSPAAPAATQVVVVGAEPGFERRYFEPAPRSGHRTAFDVAAGVGLQTGALSQAGLLFTALGRVTLGEFLSLEAGGMLADGQTVNVDGGGQLDLKLVAGFLGVCTGLASDRSRLSLALCAEPYIGRLRGTGSGFDEDRPTRDHLWLAGGLALDLDAVIAGPVRWHLRAAGLAVKKQQFVVIRDGQPDPIFESSSAALLASLGVGLHFE